MENKWENVVNEQLEIILEEAVFDDVMEQIFKKRYGIHCQRQELKTIAKELKLSQKKLKVYVEKIDNKVFNILKKHALIS